VVLMVALGVKVVGSEGQQVAQRRKGRFGQRDGVFGWINIYDVALEIHSRTSRRIWSSLAPAHPPPAACLNVYYTALIIRPAYRREAR